VKDLQAGWILAAETSGTYGGVALLHGDEPQGQTLCRMGGNQSRRLLGDIVALLEAAGIGPRDLDLLVANLGPGSFTGLRVGLATLKGLALAAGVPLVGVSSLRSLALAASARDGLIAPALDARKAEIYGAMFRSQEGKLERLLPDSVEEPAAWAQRVAQVAQGEPVLWLGEGSRQYAAALLAGSPAGSRVWDCATEGPDPTLLARAGRERALRRGTDDLATLEPNYIRPSEAETARRRREEAAQAPPR